MLAMASRSKWLSNMRTSLIGEMVERWMFLETEVHSGRGCLKLLVEASNGTKCLTSCSSVLNE
jgi:hypothetical protein